MEINDLLILLSLTDSEINALSSVPVGSMVYNSTINNFVSYNGIKWIAISSGENISIVSTSNLIVNADTTEVIRITAQSTNLNILQPTGTPQDNQSLWFRIKDNGNSISINLNSIFVDYTGDLPASTTPNKKLIFAAKYDSDSLKWNVLAWKTEP